MTVALYVVCYLAVGLASVLALRSVWGAPSRPAKYALWLFGWPLMLVVVGGVAVAFVTYRLRKGRSWRG